jgi:hypothetical protein
VRRRDGEPPDGDHLRRLPDAGRRGVRPQRGFRRPDGACPGKARTGCCPDAADVRCRRRGHGACPGTWRKGYCLDGDRPDGVLNCPVRRSGPVLPELQPWGPGVRRAWHRWTVQPERAPQAQMLQPELLPEPQPTERPGRGLQPELQLGVPAPWELPGPARAPDGKPRGWRAPWALQRELRTSKRRRRGRRCGVSSQRGPQWLKRQSERIRPVPAVWLLHLWK